MRGLQWHRIRIIKKSLTGSGRADKSQIDYMIKILLGNVALHSDHSADALAIALTHAHMRFYNIRVQNG